MMLQYTVEDMTCGSCARRISKAIEKLDPGAKVEIELDSKTVSVQTLHTDDELQARIREAGYTPVPV